jgi:hypothetical protein
MKATRTILLSAIVALLAMSVITPKHLVATAQAYEQSSDDVKAEYEAALAAYEQALGELNNAKVMAAMPKAYPRSGGGGLLGALVTIAEPFNLAEKEKAVEIAWQRLEVAKVRMMSR